MTFVLDASAVLAVLNGEAGAANVRPMLAHSVISVVNAVEVGSKLVDRGMSAEDARDAMDLLEIAMVPFDGSQAEIAVELRPLTRPAGLSLADRACLALALRNGAVAVTADRAWAPLDVGCKIELIR